jgi:hypothetical protein
MSREYTEEEQDIIDQALNMVRSRFGDVDRLCQSVLDYFEVEYPEDYE